MTKYDIIREIARNIRYYSETVYTGIDEIGTGAARLYGQCDLALGVHAISVHQWNKITNRIVDIKLQKIDKLQWGK